MAPPARAQLTLHPLEIEREGTRWGFPAAGFKGAIVGIATSLVKPKVVKGKVKGSVRLIEPDDLVPIIADPESWVVFSAKAKTDRGQMIDNHRARFPEWEAVLNIEYDADVVAFPTILRLFTAAGSAQGVGSFRRGCGGAFGGFILTEAAGMPAESEEAA